MPLSASDHHLVRAQHGWTTLMQAVSSGHMELVRFLVDENKADVHAMDKVKCTPEQTRSLWRQVGGTGVHSIAFTSDYSQLFAMTSPAPLTH